MAHIAAYSSYLIDAAQLANLTTTVNQIESYAQQEKQASDFVANLKSAISNAKASNGGGGGGGTFLDYFLQMLTLTKVTSGDIGNVTAAFNILKKYKDADASYPSAAANARKIIVNLADTLSQITPAMMYSAMVN